MDLINKYKPDLLYFDDGVLPLNNQPGGYGLKIAAHYYNSSLQWHGRNEAVMNTKGLNEAQRKCLVRDKRRNTNPARPPRGQASAWRRMGVRRCRHRRNLSSFCLRAVTQNSTPLTQNRPLADCGFKLRWLKSKMNNQQPLTI